ncbi:MAG: carbohydrate-binding domain-containing protein [Bacteroidales bacterium]|nr:carbohydrate-binding domain-containing protein [Bacteroidales bacterium]
MKLNLYPLFITVLLATCFLPACEPEQIVITADEEDEPDDGLGAYSFASDDTDMTDLDNIGASTFDRWITVEFKDGGQATVSEQGDSVSVGIGGNHVTVTNSSGDRIVYELRGTASNGSFKLYSSRKQVIFLNGVRLTNPSGAAINNQSHKRTFVVVTGENSLKDGSTYASTAGEDQKAAFFSEGQLVFSGAGSLTVTALGKGGITSDNYVRFMSAPTVSVSSSAGHGIRGKDGVTVSNGTLTVTVSADTKKGISSDANVRFEGGLTAITVTGSAAYDSEDKTYSGSAGVKADKDLLFTGGALTVTNSGTGGKGISVDGKAVFSGGTVEVSASGANYTSGDISAKAIKVDGAIEFSGATVSATAVSHEAIESKSTIKISAGDVYAFSQKDDAINSASTFTITGGIVTGISLGNDGLDANGDFDISGGVVFAAGARSPEVAIDANTEQRYKLTLTGGTIFAIGGLEGGSTLSQSCYQASSWSPSTWYTMTIGSSVYSFYTPESGGSGLVVSGSSEPTLVKGSSVSGAASHAAGHILEGGTVSGGSSVSLAAYTASSSGGGPGGGGGRPW